MPPSTMPHSMIPTPHGIDGGGDSSKRAYQTIQRDVERDLSHVRKDMLKRKYGNVQSSK